MTDETHIDEGAEEAIEDLEAPAAAQDEVAGGGFACSPRPSCGNPSLFCYDPTCTRTEAFCENASHKIVVQAM